MLVSQRSFAQSLDMLESEYSYYIHSIKELCRLYPKLRCSTNDFQKIFMEKTLDQRMHEVIEALTASHIDTKEIDLSPSRFTDYLTQDYTALLASNPHWCNLDDFILTSNDVLDTFQPHAYLEKHSYEDMCQSVEGRQKINKDFDSFFSQKTDCPSLGRYLSEASYTHFTFTLHFEENENLLYHKIQNRSFVTILNDIQSILPNRELVYALQFQEGFKEYWGRYGEEIQRVYPYMTIPYV